MKGSCPEYPHEEMSQKKKKKKKEKKNYIHHLDKSKFQRFTPPAPTEVILWPPKIIHQ